MAKNELLPFADGEDANVLPTNQWEALTDILENGFQSGIAKSEQVNRVLAQGAVASYVLGQLIVDQLNKDATLVKDTLYQNLVSALQENAKDACLPLAGGTMTGELDFSWNGVIKSVLYEGCVQMYGGLNYNNGAFVGIYGKSHARNGQIWLRANNGASASQVTLFPDGQLKVDGKEIVRIEESWSNGLNWYRKYNDGWIEQGGRSKGGASGTGAATNLNTAFTSNAYTVFTSVAIGSKSNAAVRYAEVVSRTATAFNVSTGWVTQGSYAYDTYNFDWYACGY